MLKYLIKRLILFVIVIFGVVTVTFFISHVIPADPVGAILGENAPQELVEKMERELGLDLPLGQQYTRYLKGLMYWDFGISLRTQKQVSEDLRIYFPATMELAFLALFIAIIFGISIGIISAVKRNQWQDNASRVFSLVGISMPAFWLGLLFILILYYHLGLIPAGGRLSPHISPPPMISGLYLLDSLIAGQFRTFWDALYHLLGPALVLGWIQTAYICRVTRSSMLGVLNEEYVRTARHLQTCLQKCCYSGINHDRDIFRLHAGRIGINRDCLWVSWTGKICGKFLFISRFKCGNRFGYFDSYLLCIKQFDSRFALCVFRSQD